MAIDTDELSPSQKNDLITYLTTFVSPERLQRIESVLAQRTRHVAVVVENIYQTHNASAIIRSCECFGVQDIHVIEQDNVFKTNADIVMGAEKWVTVLRHSRTDTDEHPSTRFTRSGHALRSSFTPSEVEGLRAGGQTRTCLDGLKKKGFKIAATTLRDGAIPIGELDIQKPVALVLGTEEAGLSDTAHELADVFVHLPMFGFTQSFNVSVSAALCLSHVKGKLLASEVAWQLPEEEKKELRLEWMVKAIQNGEAIVRRWRGEN